VCCTAAAQREPACAARHMQWRRCLLRDVHRSQPSLLVRAWRMLRTCAALYRVLSTFKPSSTTNAQFSTPRCARVRRLLPCPLTRIMKHASRMEWRRRSSRTRHKPPLFAHGGMLNGHATAVSHVTSRMPCREIWGGCPRWWRREKMGVEATPWIGQFGERRRRRFSNRRSVTRNCRAFALPKRVQVEANSRHCS